MITFGEIHHYADFFTSKDLAENVLLKGRVSNAGPPNQTGAEDFFADEFCFRRAIQSFNMPQQKLKFLTLRQIPT